MSEVVVIGGGAAGMVAAIAAAACSDRVTILERMDRLGKKLLATGNGRCNLMNKGALRYPGGADFAEAVLRHFDADAQRAFWQAHGLLLREEDGGRVYPASGQASTVLDVLRLSLENAGVRVVTGVQVTGVRQKHGRWTVQTEQGGWPCDRVIIAGGGCAQSKLGSDGSCWPILEALGHAVQAPRPSLTQIETDTTPIRGLSGIRVRGTVRVMRTGRCVHEETGEALFADYGVSGVCVMQCARFVQPGDVLSLDLLPGLGVSNQMLTDDLRRRKERWHDHPMEQLLTGLVVPRLASALCLQAGVGWKGRCVGTLTEREIGQLAAVMSGFCLTVRGIRGFDSAQVSAGGADVSQFDPATMASRLWPGLHAAGEVLNVDGDCGGFNLMFAFASGFLAGVNGRQHPYGGKNEHC